MDNRTKENFIAWALLSPALVVLTCFGLFPILYAFFVSLHSWRIKRDTFIGFKHYLQAIGDPLNLLAFSVAVLGIFLIARFRRNLSSGSSILVKKCSFFLYIPAIWLLLAYGLLGLIETGDYRLYNGFRVTIFYALGTIPFQLSISLFLAYLLFNSLRGKGALRILFFLPYVTPAIATAVVFRSIFSSHPLSFANGFLELLGLEGERWLSESHSIVTLALTGLGFSDLPLWLDTAFPSLALVSVILYNIWVFVGYDIVILLAGLSAIPNQYFEAAKIDGANSWQLFRHVTLPLVSPTLFFLSMVAVIGTFKAFNHIYILKNPGAKDSVDVISVVIFEQIFEFHNAGYASAMAVVLFIAIIFLTFIQNRLLGKRVFYGT
mgnify:FL=1